MADNNQKEMDRKRSFYNATYPQGLSAGSVEAWLRSLSNLRVKQGWKGIPTLLIEVQKDKNGIRHRIGIPAGHENYVINQLRTAIENGYVTPESPKDRADRRVEWTYAEELVLTTHTKQLNTTNPESWVASLLGSFGSLKDDETMLYQIILAANAHQPLPSEETEKTSWPYGPLYRSKDAINAHRDKVSDLTFQATLRVAAKAEDVDSAQKLVQRVTAAINSRSVHGVSFRPRRLNQRTLLSWVEQGNVHSMRSVLSMEEAIPLIGTPLGDWQTPGLPGARSRHMLADNLIPSSGGITIARSNFPGAERLLNLMPADFNLHMHLVGGTGVGKSTALENQAIQVMQSGGGLTFIDPHGDSFRNILNTVPAKRLDDVVVLDLTDARRPVGFNVLEGDPYVVTGQVMAVFEKLYDIYRTPLTADILRSTVLSLAILGETLLDIMPMLDPTEAGQRRRDLLMKKLKDPALLNFWREYSRLKPERKSDVIAPLQRRLRPFETYPSLRGCLGQIKSGFNLDEILASDKILLVNLSKGQLGEEEAKLFGSLFVSKFWNAVQRRAKIAKEDRSLHFLFIDEFQNYVKLPTSFDTVLAESRKYGLCFVMAHQMMSQLPMDLRDAVNANARSKMIFNVSASDASAIAREVPGIKPEDVQNLRQYEVIVRLTVDSQTLPPASAVTLPPYPATGSATEVRRASAALYGRDLAGVEAELLARQHVQKPPTDGPLFFREEDE